ncbi:hypothetical protein FRB97_003321 [Tulasnella sp. 331]|nr:hypothetical protein FRB97_003321 [Tulasnella sp. 331]
MTMSESCDEDDYEPMLDLVSIMRFDLQDLAKEKTSLYNRLRSIQDDIVFVHHVCCEYYEHLPIVPNLRCGAWYVDPAVPQVVHTPTYFKSTDGHHNHWDFNLRRANLHLLPTIQDISSSLTLHAVANAFRTLSPRQFPSGAASSIGLSHGNITYPIPSTPNSTHPPTRSLAPSILRLKNGLIDGRLNYVYVESVFDLPQLSRPLRPVWISTASTIIPQFEDDLDFYPVICLSASEHVENGVERHNGYCYVQGSGDDHESWSKGLTPMMFWRNVETVRRATPETIATIVQDIVDSHSDATASPFKHLTPITKAHSMISLGIPKSSEVEPSKALILISPLPTCIEPITSPQPRLLSLVIPAGKAGQLDLMKALTRAIAFVKLHLDAGTAVDIVGADPSDVCTGVAMAVLQALFNDAGDYTGQPASIGAFDLRTLSQQEENVVFINHPFSTAYFAGEISKQSIRKRLEWIQQSAPGMNPSRVTMNRVNEYFLSPPSMRSSLR